MKEAKWPSQQIHAEAAAHMRSIREEKRAMTCLLPFLDEWTPPTSREEAVSRLLAAAETYRMGWAERRATLAAPEPEVQEAEPNQGIFILVRLGDLEGLR